MDSRRQTLPDGSRKKVSRVPSSVNPNVRCHIHKSPSLDHSLNHSISTLILLFSSALGSPKWFQPSYKFLCIFGGPTAVPVNHVIKTAACTRCRLQSTCFMATGQTIWRHMHSIRGYSWGGGVVGGMVWPPW